MTIGKRNHEEFTESVAVKRPFRHKYYIIMVAVIVNILAMINDSTYTWSSPVLIKLLSNDTEINPFGRPITGDEESWIGSLLWIGATVGSLPFGFMADKFGRKPILLLLSVPHFFCFVAYAFATNIYVYYICRVITGIAVSGIYLVLPMYMSEIAESAFRGTFLFSYAVSANFGDLLSYVIGPYVSIKVFNLILALFPALFFILFFIFGPESPHYLVHRNDDKAKEALMLLRYNKDISKEIEDIDKEKSKNISGKIVSTLRRKYGAKALIIPICLQMFQTLTGMTVVLTYTEIIFSATGTKVSPDVSSIIVGLILFGTTTVGIFSVEKAGRRLLLTCSATGMIISEGLLGLYFYLQDHKYSNIDELHWMPLFCLVLFTISYGSGFGPLPFAITTEVCPSNIKFFVGTLVNVLGGIEYFSLTKFFNDLNDRLGRGGTFWFYSLCCCCALCFVVLVVPETQGKTFQEIQETMENENIIGCQFCKNRKRKQAEYS